MVNMMVNWIVGLMVEFDRQLDGYLMVYFEDF